MSSDMYYAYLRVMAHNSPLDALRTLKLTGCQLKRLAIILRYFGNGSMADLVDAESDLRAMLEERRSRCLD